jgi:hypothetical protein
MIALVAYYSGFSGLPTEGQVASAAKAGDNNRSATPNRISTDLLAAQTDLHKCSISAGDHKSPLE